MQNKRAILQKQLLQKWLPNGEHIDVCSMFNVKCRDYIDVHLYQILSIYL